MLSFHKYRFIGIKSPTVGIYPIIEKLKTYRRKKFAYNNVLYPLFVTMTDRFHLPTVRNFQFQLKNFGLEKSFIVIYLDSEGGRGILTLTLKNLWIMSVAILATYRCS